MAANDVMGKKTARRLGGVAEALNIAADLGFKMPQDDEKTADNNDDLVKILRELTSAQKAIANLQVELQGRKEDKIVAHLTHVAEMDKKCESLASMTSNLKSVIQNKDRIIARLQQPYSQDCIPVEAEYQKQFSELLVRDASDYEALTASVANFQWIQNFREPPSLWGEMMRPIPVALASCIRFFEAISTMRESFAILQQARAGQSSEEVRSVGRDVVESKR